MADDPDPGHKLVRRSSLGKGSKKRRMSKKKYDAGRSIMDDMAGVSDMVLLDPLTEDKLMENLEKRFKAGEIYVSSFTNSYIPRIILIIRLYYMFQKNSGVVEAVRYYEKSTTICSVLSLVSLSVFA